jgi:membrane fusion protein, multidrug efflux system
MSSRRWIIVVVGLLVLGVASWLARGRKASPAAAGAQGAPAGGAAGGDPRSRLVPVVAAVATRRDVPIVLEGLGTVVASRTVTVRAQVDGKLEAVLFREGQLVRKGDVLARIDPRPFQIQLQQAEGALARDRAQLENARVNVRRYDDLAREKLIAPQQADDQRAAASQLEGAIRMDEAAIASARLNLDYARITSPIDGVVGVRLVDEGNLVRASDANGLVVVTQLDPAAVLFTLPQDELPRVAGELARRNLPVELYGRDGSATLGKGELTAVDNQINLNTATVRLKAVVPNRDRQLWPNQFVKVRLMLAPSKDALVVPATAVQRGPAGVFAFVIGEGDVVTARPIEVASTQGDVALVAKGIAEGDRVVADGGNQLRAGSKVAVRDAGARPGSPAPQAGTQGTPR